MYRISYCACLYLCRGDCSVPRVAFQSWWGKGEQAGFSGGCVCGCAMSAWAATSHPFPSSLTCRGESRHSQAGMGNHALRRPGTHSPSGSGSRVPHKTTVLPLGWPCPSPALEPCGHCHLQTSVELPILIPPTCPLWARFTSSLVITFVGRVVSGPGLEGLRNHHRSLGTRLLQGRLGLLDSEKEGREESSSSWPKPR